MLRVFVCALQGTAFINILALRRGFYSRAAFIRGNTVYKDIICVCFSRLLFVVPPAIIRDVPCSHLLPNLYEVVARTIIFSGWERKEFDEDL